MYEETVYILYMLNKCRIHQPYIGLLAIEVLNDATVKLIADDVGVLGYRVHVWGHEFDIPISMLNVYFLNELFDTMVTNTINLGNYVFDIDSTRISGCERIRKRVYGDYFVLETIKIIDVLLEDKETYESFWFPSPRVLLQYSGFVFWEKLMWYLSTWWFVRNHARRLLSLLRAVRVDPRVWEALYRARYWFVDEVIRVSDADVVFVRLRTRGRGVVAADVETRDNGVEHYLLGEREVFLLSTEFTRLST